MLLKCEMNLKMAFLLLNYWHYSAWFKREAAHSLGMQAEEGYYNSLFWRQY